MNWELDLVVLVADVDAEWTMRTLLGQRTESLGIRHLKFEVVRHPGRDAGVLMRAVEFLRLYLRRARHAVVMLDHEGSGREDWSAAEIEDRLEADLRRNGWQHSVSEGPRAVAIVLDPKLEVWVWHQLPRVAEVVGLTEERLAQMLSSTARLANGKPQRPKETLQKALRTSGRPFSPSIFRELAEKVSLRASERAYDKLKTTLQTWFPKDKEAHGDKENG